MGLLQEAHLSPCIVPQQRAFYLLILNVEEKMMMKDELERLSAAHTRFNFRCQTTKPGNHWEHLQEKDLVASLPFRPAGLGI
jgi:hypothetical protein